MFGIFLSKEKRVERNSVNMFDTYMPSISGMDDQEIGGLLDIAAQIKTASLSVSFEDKNAELIYHEPIVVPSGVLIDQLLIYQNQMSRWSRDGSTGLARIGALGIWYLSIAACTFPILRNRGRELWGELERGYEFCSLFDPERDSVKGLEPKKTA